MTANANHAILADYELPPGTLFPDSAPRYPNLWVLVHESLADSYRAAITLVMEQLEACTDMYNDFGYAHAGEGCDAFARRRGLQPVRLGPDGARSHDHCVHLRFYFAPLRAGNPVETAEGRYYQVAASVHYEVDRPQRFHPYIDECPHCGCTGEYGAYMGGTIREKNERVHDPLGLELILYGTVRGEDVIAFDGLNRLADRFEVRIAEFVPGPDRADVTTGKVGLVFLGARG
ncbi:hypothetical protein I8J29_23390 [Paenibacillus sp. MWE-103]|uniref:Uncharacterized protein n=1 Tax=Paenibacillus artemisiicola TaxID=1172618 RepID=A0ABS3WFR1_9BACL|nr:hypothetical protein [Paenibacillus artemisiicola]MBO7747150.1 hypothetical protein [Paenibacillus artemisiicola]